MKPMIMYGSEEWKLRLHSLTLANVGRDWLFLQLLFLISFSFCLFLLLSSMQLL